ncbi:FlgN protein [Planctomycetes bacterium Poly30]|uniref:FlgN protein n=1 Tax=Saltatorellus ferox TaxID=2528018 RepID=A0A518F0V4_9BACT|nr:FlgN protein [Planctomycetes bacterium Poly30]
MKQQHSSGSAAVKAVSRTASGLSVNAQKLSNRLLVAVRDDVAAHGRVVEILRTQEASIVRPADAAFRQATESLEGELERIPFRKTQRDRIFRDLGVEFGIEPTALTIRSVAERLGAAGAPLLAEGERLREVATEVQRLNRRVAALVRMHREVTREILNTVLADGSGRAPLDGGTLIDAQV